MISFTAAIRRRPGMSRAAFFRYLKDIHGAIATAEPGGMSLYRQNHVRDAVAGTPGQAAYSVPPDRDSVTELLFDELPAMFADLARPYTREKIGPDGANFSDRPTATALVTDVSELDLPNPGRGAAKVVAFLPAAPGLDLPTFIERWSAAQAAVDPAVLDPIRSLTVQRRLAEGDTAVGYFGGEDAVAYLGVISFWFDDAGSALDGAGAYLAALSEADGFIDSSRSWRALVDEVVIYQR